MYRILIVDDDAIIRRGLKKTIDWEAYDIEITGTACDGQEALEMLQKTEPQLILTDIIMPVMDGIELMKNARMIYPDIQVILLTAYEDFAYAKEAIKNKACDYLLKPVAQKELLEAVLNARNQYEIRIKEAHHRNKSLPLLKRQFLVDLMSGYFSESKMLADIEELNLHICSAQFVCMDLLLVDYFDKGKELCGELLKYSVCNCIEELAQSMEEVSAEVFQGQEDHIYIILSSHEKEINAEELAWEFAGDIRNVGVDVLVTEIAVGIGKKYTGLEHLQEAVKETFAEKKYLTTFIEKNPFRQADAKMMLANKAERYVRAHYTDSMLSLNQVAEKLHVSAVYLSMVFKKTKQMTFSEFLSEIRMDAAKELVLNTNLKAYEIGERVGYVNANYFSGLFKRKYHMSISEYRKRAARCD